MPSCRHCRHAVDVLTDLELCDRCHHRPTIRVLYEIRRPGWTPAWEEHIRRLEERARLELPLFEAGYATPPDGGDRDLERRLRLRARKRRLWRLKPWKKRPRPGPPLPGPPPQLPPPSPAA